MKQVTPEAGFSAVELLITLFIAVAFIGAGYQLYGIAIKDGSDVRLRTQASAVAYAQLRTTAAGVPSTCTPSSQNIAVPADSGLGNASMTATITCPYGTASSLSAVAINLPYGTDSPQKKVTHALYATAQ